MHFVEIDCLVLKNKVFCGLCLTKDRIVQNKGSKGSKNLKDYKGSERSFLGVQNHSPLPKAPAFS